MSELRYLAPVELIGHFYPKHDPTGCRYERLEDCEKCKQYTTHTFICVRPRYWLYECHLCANPQPPTEEP